MFRTRTEWAPRFAGRAAAAHAAAGLGAAYGAAMGIGPTSWWSTAPRAALAIALAGWGAASLAAVGAVNARYVREVSVRDSDGAVHIRTSPATGAGRDPVAVVHVSDVSVSRPLAPASDGGPDGAGGFALMRAAGRTYVLSNPDPDTLDRGFFADLALRTAARTPSAR